VPNKEIVLHFAAEGGAAPSGPGLLDPVPFFQTHPAFCSWTLIRGGVVCTPLDAKERREAGTITNCLGPGPRRRCPIFSINPYYPELIVPDANALPNGIRARETVAVLSVFPDQAKRQRGARFPPP